MALIGVLPLEGGSDIEIGHHVQRTWLGMTFNVDTIISTLVAGVLVLLLGFWATRALRKDTEDHVPTKPQILWELVVGEVNKQVEDNLGKVHPYVAPLAISLFFFILFCNWLELVPTELTIAGHDVHLLPAPTADTNLTYALAAVTMVSVWTYGIRQKGVKGYFRHFIEPFPVLAPLNVLEELIKPITLALRLFGNIFAGGIMLALIGLIPLYAMWAPNLLWKAFDAIIGVIQAFIFALLTVLYFAMAGAGHEEHESHEEYLDEERRKKAEAAHADDAAPVPAH
ncbi:F0F1 ATP synthase subunit A [Nocardioides mangrovi]|uniref:ATP synthase subunit a n=1 Tax=Nocardioides mangrovi TaxID=2874580 RepID=A0ABS7U6H3_9ACTN|nr:F0F1 ATP synthase subunit A [Nocardioides mangrovi]MBZ5736585.1 F0F1 ATP synthase subunit A [Nocardioides mangrovi]